MIISDGNKLLQDKPVKFLKGQKEWIRSGGSDHIIVAHTEGTIVFYIYPCGFWAVCSVYG